METLKFTGVVERVETKSGVSKKGASWTMTTYNIDVSGEIYPVTFFNLESMYIFEGETVHVQCKLESREWNERYYLQLRGEAIESDKSINASNATAATEIPVTPKEPLTHSSAQTKSQEQIFEDDNDLPF